MTIHRLVPTIVLENCAAERWHGSFPAVGLFVDISGFSALADVLMERGQHGAERLTHTAPYGAFSISAKLE